MKRESKTGHEQIVEQALNRCQHFNGLMNDVCRAGVAYREVGGAGRWPCLRSMHGEEVECPQRQWTTSEQAESEADRADAYIRQMNERAARNECWHCGKPIQKKVQVGRCIYAEPCGCRLGQGRLG
jgi:hypothetical protein